MPTSNILFVDDELSIHVDEESSMDADEHCGDALWYYVSALADEGFTVKEARCPDEALRLLAAEGPYHLIVLDIMMPPGDVFRDKDTREGLRTGVELARLLYEKDIPIPIIVLTNLRRQALKEQLGFPNVRMILEKGSCTPFALVDYVRRTLEHLDPGKPTR